MKIKKNKKIKPWLAPIVYFGLKNKAYDFLENLSYFFSAGMSVTNALINLEKENDSWRMRKVIRKIREDVERGISLANAFKNQNFFGESTVEIIRSGEYSGKLAENLKLIITIHDEDKKLKSKLSSSLLYGTIIILITVLVGIGTSWFVLPKIAGVYSEMGTELPFLTQMLIKVGNFMVAYGNIVVPFCVSFVVIILYFLFSFPKTKFIGHLLLFYVPLLRRLIKESEITRFGYLMGSIIEAGLPINKAFEILPGTTTFKNYKNLYRDLGEKISQGIFISEALRSHKNTKKLIPSGVLQMISSAEKSGKLSETFLRIGNLYGTKLENTSRNLPIIIEPLLLLIVGIGVALFVLATMLPIYNLGDIIK